MCMYIQFICLEGSLQIPCDKSHSNFLQQFSHTTFFSIIIKWKKLQDLNVFSLTEVQNVNEINTIHSCLNMQNVHLV